MSVSPPTPHNLQNCWPISAKDKNGVKALKRNLTSFIEFGGWIEDTEPDWCPARNKASVTAQQFSFLIDLLLPSQQIFCQHVSAKVALNYWEYIMSSAQLISAGMKNSWGDWKGKSNGVGHKAQHKWTKLLQQGKGRDVRISNTNPQKTTALALLFSEPFGLLFLLRQQKSKHNQGTMTIKWLLIITMNFEHQKEQKISSVSKWKRILFLDCIDWTQPAKWSHCRILQRSLKEIPSYMILQLVW